MDAQKRGKMGEDLALADYLRRGYSLLQRNFRVRAGEIDIILRGPNGVLVFCEVKMRRAGGCMLPREAVDAKKQARVRAAALAYLALNGLSEPPMRFDVAEVLLAAGSEPSICCIENAF